MQKRIVSISPTLMTHQWQQLLQYICRCSWSVLNHALLVQAAPYTAAVCTPVGNTAFIGGVRESVEIPATRTMLGSVFNRTTCT